jgi:hypothetical protein
MLLDNVVENSNYVTDEELTDANLVGLSNTALAEVNAKCGTKLPLFTNENASETPYTVIPDFWVLRLIEPYLAYGIAANDTDTNARDFHYNRFIQAVTDFRSNGLSSIVEEFDPETGEQITDYSGDSIRMMKVDASDVTVNWMGWI